MRTRTHALLAGALAGLLLAGCSAGEDSSMAGMQHHSSAGQTATSGTATLPADVNAADQMFVTMMIPHHQQAIEMSDLLLGKDAVDSRVGALATQIKDAQAPEITTMKGWLADWGTPYDGSMSGEMSGHASGMGGMLSDQELTTLKNAGGREAARLYLTGMIGHHEGAVEMAQAEVADGKNPAVIALAQQVISSQTAEITTMRQLLTSL